MGYEQEFENQLLKARGNSFQDLFYRLMKEYFQDFMPIKPNGPFGDLGCDGYRSSSGMYFQVYGPEEPYLNSTMNYAEKKINIDFLKLYDNLSRSDFFPDIRQYCFVFNNKTDASLTMNISQEIEKLKSEYSDIQFSLWDNQMLLMMFGNLDGKAQGRVLSHYMEKQYDAKEYLEKLQFENIVHDIECLRALKQEAQELMTVISNNDFIAPFYVDIIDNFDSFIQKLEKIKFNDNQLENAKMESLSSTYSLLSFIIQYSKVSGSMALMKRIEPWGEITNEKFDDVRDRMIRAREKSYGDIDNLLKQENILKQQIK